MSLSHHTSHTSPGAHRVSPTPFALGTRCARCHCYLLRGFPSKRGLSGKWRHDTCENLGEPDRADFVELAEALMRIQPWPRLVSLEAQLVEATGALEIAKSRGRAFPAQRSDTEDGEPSRGKVLLDRIESIRVAIAEERDWKAGRLAAEWADGH